MAAVLWPVLWAVLAVIVPSAAVAGARIDPAESVISELPSGDVTATLALTQGVPHRVFVLSGPPRLVIDLRDTDIAGIDARTLVLAPSVTDIRMGVYRPGWVRLVARLARPMRVHRAGMTVDEATGAARLAVRLTHDPANRAPALPPPSDDPLWRLADPTPAPTDRPPLGARPTVVMIDPGHGGFDPGAQVEGVDEADIVLTFARDLAEVLNLREGIEAHLTRQSDVFVPLETRMVMARRVGADILISVHADALAEGRASGVTVYTLSREAADRASAELAAELNRADLVAGLDLGEADDPVAAALMDLARPATQARSRTLAELMVARIGDAMGQMRRRPHLSAAFEVLKAPDIASVLLELGFISNPLDRANMANPQWRRQVAEGIAGAIAEWTRIEGARQRRALK